MRAHRYSMLTLRGTPYLYCSPAGRLSCRDGWSAGIANLSYRRRGAGALSLGSHPSQSAALRAGRRASLLDLASAPDLSRTHALLELGMPPTLTLSVDARLQPKPNHPPPIGRQLVRRFLEHLAALQPRRAEPEVVVHQTFAAQFDIRRPRGPFGAVTSRSGRMALASKVLLAAKAAGICRCGRNRG